MEPFGVPGYGEEASGQSRSGGSQKERNMKRAALFVLSLALILPITWSLSEPPASALTCHEQCQQVAFQCQQACQGQGAACRQQCNLDYNACVAGCP